MTGPDVITTGYLILSGVIWFRSLQKTASSPYCEALTVYYTTMPPSRSRLLLATPLFLVFSCSTIQAEQIFVVDAPDFEKPGVSSMIGLF